MKKINLAKYGFERWPEEDFSDDGNRFTCYKHPDAPNVRISKLTAHGNVYIDGSLEQPQQDLTYEEYSKLDHYDDLDALNGVNAESVTEDQLKEFASNCIAFSKAYVEKVKKLASSVPTRQEIENKVKAIQTFYKDVKQRLDAFYDLELKQAMLVHVPYGKSTYYLNEGIKEFRESYDNVAEYLNRDVAKETDRVMSLNRVSKLSFMNNKIEFPWQFKYAKQYIQEHIKLYSTK